MDKKALINHLDPRAGLWLLFIANIGMNRYNRYENIK